MSHKIDANRYKASFRCPEGHVFWYAADHVLFDLVAAPLVHECLYCKKDGVAVLQSIRIFP
jgi:hypothetical protein